MLPSFRHYRPVQKYVYFLFFANLQHEKSIYLKILKIIPLVARCLPAQNHFADAPSRSFPRRITPRKPLEHSLQTAPEQLPTAASTHAYSNLRQIFAPYACTPHTTILQLHHGTPSANIDKLTKSSVTSLTHSCPQPITVPIYRNEQCCTSPHHLTGNRSSRPKRMMQDNIRPQLTDAIQAREPDRSENRSAKIAEFPSG